MKIFDNEKYNEILNVAIVMYGLPFQCVEYKGIRTVFTYLLLKSKLTLETLPSMMSWKCIKRWKID